MIKKILKKISGQLQGATASYERHNAQYEEHDKLEKERVAGLKNIESDLINDTEMRVRDLLTRHSHIKTAVDVGSGTGWSAAALTKMVDTVIAIEPSVAAIDISKKIYSEREYSNITWITGLAEVELPKLTLTEPTLFLTGCVLSHIRDTEVKKICQAICAVAPAGSIFSLAECWGDKEWHQLMWHVRTKDWWQAQFPGWELDFHGPLVPESTAETGPYHKGIWGVKQS